MSRSLTRPAAKSPPEPSNFFNTNPPKHGDTIAAARAALREAALQLVAQAERAELPVLFEHYKTLRGVFGKLKYVAWQQDRRRLRPPNGG
jgi:hypothetical protein